MTHVNFFSEIHRKIKFSSNFPKESPSTIPKKTANNPKHKTEQKKSYHDAISSSPFPSFLAEL